MLLKNNIKRMLFQSPFEWGCVAIFLIYIALCLTPSSYGLVLNIFGMNGEGLLWGNPRAIRSDEWAVWTPYFQSVVNNDFSRFNHLSLYNEDFRGFSALPIYDWALIFKPLLWPFLIFNDAYAFSIHHALIMLAFILGWKQLVDRLIPEARQYFISGSFSLLLFFSGFVQVWWTTLGPILALTPWLFIVIFWCEKITPMKILVFSYVAIAWLLSHTYPPIIISCAYVALLLVLSFKRGLLNLSSIIGLALGSVVGLAIVYVYLADAVEIMTQTVYPGKRISQGGAVPWQLWLSAFVPYINHSNYEPLYSINICELGVVSSLLPMMATIFTSYRSLTNVDIKVVVFFIITLIFMSLWMLAPVPAILAKITLLDHVPGSRLVWGLGLVLNILALYVLIKSKVIFSYSRIIVFSLVVVGSYLGSCFYYSLPIGKKSAWELISIFLLFGMCWAAKKRQANDEQKKLALLITALLINFIYFGAFNPGQSAKPIFSLKNSTALEPLKAQQDAHPQGWLVVEGYPGAVLQGLGFKSVTHVLMMPKLDFFRTLFPEMDSQSFDKVFNRYAHIQLSNDLLPYSPQADVIRIPGRVFGFKKNKIENITIQSAAELEVEEAGYIDLVEITDNKLVFIGWGMFSSDKRIFLSNFPTNIEATLERIPRPDVITALNNHQLSTPGFKLTINLSEKIGKEEILSSLCLYVKDETFGVKKIQPGNAEIEYRCKP